jgi:porphobilinogen deaminase
MGSDDTTDRLFPHQMIDESAEVERPIAIGPSIRQEFINHRNHIDAELAAWRGELKTALERLSAPPDVTPASAARKVGRGALQGTKWGAAVLAGLGLLQLGLKAKRPDLAGPLDDLIQLFQ